MNAAVTEGYSLVKLLKSMWWNATFLPHPFYSSILSPPFPFGPFQWFWASAVIFPSGVWGGSPAEIVFGAFKP